MSVSIDVGEHPHPVQELEALPTAPKFDADRSRVHTDPDAFEVKIDEYRKPARAFDDAYGIYDGEARDSVDAFGAREPVNDFETLVMVD